MAGEDTAGLKIALGKTQSRRASSMEGVMKHLTFAACLEQHRAGNLAMQFVFAQRVNQHIQANPRSNPTHGIHQAHVFCRIFWHFPLKNHQIEARTLIGGAACIGSEHDEAGR